MGNTLTYETDPIILYSRSPFQMEIYDEMGLFDINLNYYLSIDTDIYIGTIETNNIVRFRDVIYRGEGEILFKITDSINNVYIENEYLTFYTVPCFTEDTYILCANRNYKKITMLNVGDLVYTPIGNYPIIEIKKTLFQININYRNSCIYEIFLSGLMDKPLYVTPNHRILYQTKYQQSLLYGCQYPSNKISNKYVHNDIITVYHISLSDTKAYFIIANNLFCETYISIKKT